MMTFLVTQIGSTYYDVAQICRSYENMLDHENQSSIGEGFINWIDLLKKISETPCEVIAIEHDDPKDYKSYITKSLEYLLKI